MIKFTNLRVLLVVHFIFFGHLRMLAEETPNRETKFREEQVEACRKNPFEITSARICTNGKACLCVPTARCIDATNEGEVKACKAAYRESTREGRSTPPAIDDGSKILVSDQSRCHSNTEGAVFYHPAVGCVCSANGNPIDFDSKGFLGIAHCEKRVGERRKSVVQEGKYRGEGDEWAVADVSILAQDLDHRAITLDIKLTSHDGKRQVGARFHCREAKEGEEARRRCVGTMHTLLPEALVRRYQRELDGTDKIKIGDTELFLMGKNTFSIKDYGTFFR